MTIYETRMGQLRYTEFMTLPCCRENLCLVPDTRISGARVARELDALIRIYGKPACIVSDNWTEFTSKAILKWANDNKAEWHYIDPPLAHVNMRCRAAGQAATERLHRVLQRQLAGRMPE